MIFSDDVPSLETALHKAFEDKTVEFIVVPDAEQYRVSEKMRNCEN